MQSKVLLDYELAVSADAYVVRALLRLQGRPPENGNRMPLNLALVLDRSGSMSGAKLAAAKDAAAHVARCLHPEDILSVVAYDDVVTTVAEPAAGSGQGDLLARIQDIHSGGSTNLSGGWLRGRELVARNRRDIASNRVLLLTDGLANVGITDHAQLVALTRAARGHGITTTTIGFGADYNEHLLQAMADAGGGHSYYIERPDQAPGVFAEELEGLLTLAAQNVSIEIRPGAATQLTTIHHSFPRSDVPGGCRLDLGDLYAREPKSVLLEFRVAAQATPSPVQVAELRITGHVLTAGGGLEHHQITLKLTTPLSPEGHVEPEVRREILLLDAARAREDALEARRRGNIREAQSHLTELAERLRAEGDLTDAAITDEIAELRAVAENLAGGVMSELDAKYLHQQSHDIRRAKRMALDRIARTRRPGKRENND